MNRLKYYSISLLITYFIALVFLIISSAIFAYTSINDNYLDIFVFGIIGISALVGSLILNKKIKEKGILNGIIFGFIYILILYILTMLLYKGFFISNTVLMYLGISVLASCLGGIIGVNL